MPYVMLLVAIAGEVAGTSLLRATDGFTRLWPTVWCGAAYAVSFLGLTQVVKKLPVGFTYAVWSGVGTVAIVIIGALFLHERINAGTVVGVALVIAGVVILNLTGSHHAGSGALAAHRSIRAEWRINRPRRRRRGEARLP